MLGDIFFDNWLSQQIAEWWVGKPLPKPSGPAFQPAPAPQTPAKLRDWSLDDLYEATMQRVKQYEIDSKPQSGGVITGPSLPDDEINTWLWLALGGAGAIAALFLIRRI